MRMGSLECFDLGLKTAPLAQQGDVFCGDVGHKSSGHGSY
jgi:hypothetical protein